MKETLAGKVARLAQAVEAVGSAVIAVEVKHADGCPAIRTQRLIDCTCDPDFKIMTPDHRETEL